MILAQRLARERTFKLLAAKNGSRVRLSTKRVCTAIENVTESTNQAALYFKWLRHLQIAPGRARGIVRNARTGPAHGLLLRCFSFCARPHPVLRPLTFPHIPPAHSTMAPRHSFVLLALLSLFSPTALASLTSFAVPDDATVPLDARALFQDSDASLDSSHGFTKRTVPRSLGKAWQVRDWTFDGAPSSGGEGRWPSAAVGGSRASQWRQS